MCGLSIGLIGGICTSRLFPKFKSTYKLDSNIGSTYIDDQNRIYYLPVRDPDTGQPNDMGHPL